LSAEIALKLVFVVSFAYAATIAAHTAKAAARKHGGSVNQLSNELRWLVFVRAALGLVFYVALIGWFVRSGRPAWAYLPIDMGIRVSAATLFIPVLAFYTWSFRSLGTNYRGGVGLYDAHELVTTGPYRTLRHPIYASFIAIMILLLMMSANWMLGASGILLVSTIAAGRIPVEERELNARFGDKWQSYVRNRR
jgi:protein-S-isoprenylcysteine O-methyltransferase Ste14